MSSKSYIVTIDHVGNVTDRAENVHTILTTTDHIKPSSRVLVNEVDTLYAVTVHCQINRPSGTSTRHSPTFYLNSQVQGIIDEQHAEKIAREMFGNVLEMAGHNDVQVIAHAVKVQGS